MAQTIKGYLGDRQIRVVQIKAVVALHGITVNMHKLFQGFPVNMFYVPTADGDGNCETVKLSGDNSRYYISY